MIWRFGSNRMAAQARGISTYVSSVRRTVARLQLRSSDGHPTNAKASFVRGSYLNSASKNLGYPRTQSFGLAIL